MRDSLAVSDALVGYAPAGLIGDGRRTPRSRATTCCSCSPTRCASPARGCSRASSAPAAPAPPSRALAFAYAPWRLEQEGHLHVISSGGDPARAVPARARLPARQRRHDPRRLARRDLAVLARLLARPAARLPGSPPARSRSRSCWWRRGRPRAAAHACSSRPPPGCSASRSSPACSRGPTCACSTTTPRRERTIEDVAGVLRAAVRVPRRRRERQPRVGRRDRAAARRPERDPRADAVSRPRDPRAGARRAARRRAAAPRLRRWLGVGVLALRRPVARLSAQRRLVAVSLPLAVRAAARLAGHPRARPAAHADDAVPRAARRRRRAGAGGARPRALGRARRRRPRVALACVAILAEGWGFADHPTVPLAPAGQRAAPQPALHLPDRARPTTAATCCGRPTASRRSSTAAAASSRASSRPCMRATRELPRRALGRRLRRLGVRSVTVHLARAPRGSPLRRRVNPVAARPGPRAPAARRGTCSSCCAERVAARGASAAPRARPRAAPISAAAAIEHDRAARRQLAAAAAARSRTAPRRRSPAGAQRAPTRELARARASSTPSASATRDARSRTAAIATSPCATPARSSTLCWKRPQSNMRSHPLARVVDVPIIG